jgi:hypothetical protein
LVPFPTFTPIPLSLALPFFDNLETGPAAWSVNGTWVLQDATPLDGTGQAWYVNSNDGTVATLSLMSSLDLRTAPQPMLRFDSLTTSSHSVANLEVSVDGYTWQTLFNVQPSATWQPKMIDLSTYQQQTIWLRWVWISQVPATGQTLDFWIVDNVVVADASLLQPTVTPTPSAPPTIEPSITPSATETPTATDTPEGTEDISQNLDAQTNGLPLETATVDPLIAPA